MNEQNIQERAELGFYRNMWDTYKGHARGLLSGIAVGGLVGAAIGLATSAAIASFVPLSIGSVILSFVGLGAVFGTQQFGAAGAAAASRASGLAEKHARLLDYAHNGDKLAELDDKLMADGRGHHYEFPQGRDKGKFFVWKSGAVGATVGAGLGGLLGSLHVASAALDFVGIHISALANAAKLIGVTGLTGMPLLGALGAGIIGLTFGVERRVFKSIFNQTDATIQGKLFHRTGPDIGREQTLGKESDYALGQHRLRRQAEINGLEKDYNQKILRGATSGLFRGLAGGVATGALIGLGAGALAFGIACLPCLLVTGAHFVGWSMLGELATSFAGMGAVLGMETFTQAGMEAGAETTARSIDNEFARNRELRARGITPSIQPTPKKEWFNWKKALAATLAGAALGAITSPLMATMLSLELGTGAMLAAGAITFGLIGMTYGIGNSVWHALTKATDWVYDRSYFGNDEMPALEPAKARLQEMASTRPYGKVTAEEAALLNERLNTNRNFTQTIAQQSQAAPASVGV